MAQSLLWKVVSRAKTPRRLFLISTSAWGGSRGGDGDGVVVVVVVVVVAAAAASEQET